MSAGTDCSDVRPLRLGSTTQEECGVFLHNAIVWLEQEDGVSADRDALITLRSEVMHEKVRS